MVPEPGAGTVIDGRYRVLSRLGAGGMAEVYLAEDQQLGRKVALKLLHRRFAEDAGFVERFRREAQAAAGLQHPNVVSVYDRGSYDGTYYIAMEYLPGPSLKDLIRQEAPLPPLRAIDLTLQILKAARFAHHRGIIHRDLKPHNVIVGEGDHAKVTDFGIARAGASDMTETGSIMGTAQYLSPEQAQGMAVNPTSDLYSVGVILFELLTGRVPFDAESAVTIALRHVSEAPPPPRSLNPAIPPQLEGVVLWALNKDPADRPPDADAFIAALEDVRRRIEAGEAGERTASFAAVAAGVPAGAGVAAAAAAGEPDAGAVIVDVPGLEEPPPLPPEQDNRWWWALLALLLIVGVGIGAYLLTRTSTKVVPPVVGEQVSIAQTNIQNAGFTPNLISRTDSAPAGRVIAQSPNGGTHAADGSTVTLTVSQGPGNTTVPSVAGLPQAQATKALQRAHLKLARVERESSDNFPAGQVTRSDPAAGTSLPVATAVTLFVSSGKPRRQVPDVTGESQSAATADLHHAGFKVTVTTQESSTTTPGNVISQAPAGNSSAADGSTVSLVIAKAPSTAKVPDVTGDTAQAAANNLTAAGFKVKRQTRNVTAQNQDGIVVSQTPPGNAQARKGSTVTIVVGKSTATSTTTTTTSTPSSTTTTTTSST
jgi:serine/threonine-protein kinase